MTVQNEEEYQLGMSRLGTLDSANPANLAEMEALGHALEAYEDRNGHAPQRPHAPGARIQLAAQGAPGHDPRTGHLRPVIDFLLAKGNRPSHWWHEDGFWFDQGGELHYTFTEPIDAAELREHFAFPPSITLSDDGTIKDGVNHFDIYHSRPAEPFSSELPQTGS